MKFSMPPTKAGSSWLETGRFTYCENHQGKQRCRNSNADNAWHSGDTIIDR